MSPNNLKAGDHVALFYRSRAEQFDCTIPYIQAGLERNERCVYIADDNSVLSVLNRLGEAGIDVDAAQARDALRVVTKHETYLRHGMFEPQKMISDLQALVEDSFRDGFSGLRASGEMTWALDLPSSLSRLASYEASLDSQFTTKYIALCQYDETRFSGRLLSQMIRIHPKLIVRGLLMDNPFYLPNFDSSTSHGPPVTVDHLLAAQALA